MTGSAAPGRVVQGYHRAGRKAPAARLKGVPHMGLDDKISNATEEKTGKLKESVGKATDDEDLEAEGKVDKAKGNLKQAGEKVKDAFK